MRSAAIKAAEYFLGPDTPVPCTKRLFEVIDSCESVDQVQVAARYTVLFLKKNAGWHRAWMADALKMYLKDKCALLRLRERNEKT